jgi:hypothetical protein
MAFLILSCNAVTFDEKYYVSYFNKHELVFENMISYIDSIYIQSTDRSREARKVILPCGKKKAFDKSDYRLCDSTLEVSMIKYNIAAIKIEKDVCFYDRNFDLVTFEVKQNTRISYQYSFCNSYKDVSETNNMRSISLKRNWSLFIDKE